MLIDKTYFVGDLTIAQRSQPEVAANLDAFIEKYEPKFLKLLLGLGFYEDFEASLPPVSGDPEQRWIDLAQGKIYTYQEKQFEWIGFQNSAKESPIANFVYYQYLTNEITQTTGMGQVKPATENGSLATPLTKLLRAWNEMVEWNRSLIHFLRANRDVYPEWIPYSENYWWECGCYPCNRWPKELWSIKNSFGL